MKILMLDIETAPNIVATWGMFRVNIGTDNIIETGHTICYAARWYDSSKTEYKSIYHHSEEEMVEALWLLLDEADVVVHYNGTKFDIPTLNKEFVRLGYVPPSTYHQIDLLKVVRKQFRFTSNKLDYICQELDIGSKMQHKGILLWVGCMNNDAKDWKVMKEYNIKDIDLLEELYEELLPWITNHPNRALWLDDVSEPTCKNCGSTNVKANGVERTKTQQYQRYKCNDCGANLRSRKLLKKADEGVLV